MDPSHMLFLHVDPLPPGPPLGRTAWEWQAGFCPWCTLWLRRCHWEGHVRGAMHQAALARAAAAAAREAEQRQRREEEQRR